MASVSVTAPTEAFCQSCHVGYGWKDANFDFSDETKVDCLACHNTGNYLKLAGLAGHPPLVRTETSPGSGKFVDPVDLDLIGLRGRRGLLLQIEHARQGNGHLAADQPHAKPVPRQAPADLGGGVKLELVWCPAGSFTMGSPEDEPLRRPDEVLREVTLTRSFLIKRTEVTQGEYAPYDVMGLGRLSACPLTPLPGEGHLRQRPTLSGSGCKMMIFPSEITGYEGHVKSAG